MHKYIWNLLMLVLATISTCTITPCHAQTPAKSDSQNTDNISAISSNSPSAIQLRDLSNSTDSKPTILSETVSNTSVSQANITAPQPKIRIPIFSRIFRTPSMQQ
ncbi:MULTISPECIES: hypothetical protein [Nostoc]|uniref:Uncharacterized protein n=1 Tax=Nostoc paludosum FACHB-159 TaxID=2692908 RepID=A0ABR8KEJ2_9NOSO|nr:MULTISPECIES: hypothetical protein [Nostoc]MBD2681522.1 hypothetical protein [Nostoc sp. FACHB-857]MBD2737983.1 hypothetical protein [Nostoc paludosum FACHB-159]